MITLPVVTRETALGAATDLIRDEMQATEGQSPLLDRVLTVARENPEILQSVNWMMSDCSEQEKNAAMAGMAITYSALKAQAEIEALERLGGC